MLYRQKIAFIMTILFFMSGLHAHSVFSFEGLPLQDYNYDVYSLGMGETGISDIYRKNTGFFNPSLSTTLNQVYFSTGISSGYYTFEDPNDSFRNDGVSFPYFNTTVPLGNHRIGFNYSSYLSGNAKVRGDEREEDDLRFTETNEISSYIYKGSLIYAFKNRIVNFGLSFDYYLGHRNRSWKRNYSATGVFEDPQYRIEERFGNYGFSFGLNRKFDDISLGMAYHSAIDLEGSAELITIFDDYRIDITGFQKPQHFAFGLTWRFVDTYRFSSDIHYEMWSDTDYYTSPRDTWKVSLGIAHQPQWVHDSWLRNVPFRFGGYYRELPFKADGEPIEEMALTFGLSIPLEAPNSQVDMSVKYSSRGDVDTHGYSDSSLVFSIGLSGFDFFRSRQKKTTEREIPEAEFETFRY